MKNKNNQRLDFLVQDFISRERANVPGRARRFDRPVFTTVPVELLSAGNYMELAITLTGTAGGLASDSRLGVGLLNTDGVPGGSFYLLMATHAVVPATDRTRIATNQFDGSGNFVLTNTPDPEMPKTFYRLQLP